MVDEHLHLILAAIADARSDMKEDIQGVHNRLDHINGRTRTLEKQVFTQWFFWGAVGALSLVLVPMLVEWLAH